MLQPSGSNYNISVLSVNLARRGLSVFPMTPADIEGGEDKASIVSGSRLADPFGEHVVAEGSRKQLVTCSVFQPTEGIGSACSPAVS